MTRPAATWATVLGVAAIAAAAGIGLLLASPAEAASGTLTIGTATIASGSSGTVDLRSNVGAPGLGAWTIDITYNPAIVSVAAGGCSPQYGVCNPAFSANQIRISGANAYGLTGDSLLSTIAFQCNTTGASALTLTANIFVDATVGAPAAVTPTVTNGQITCTAPPATPTPTPPFEGFAIPGGTYVGDVRGTGTITVVVTPDGQGISEVRIDNLVTPCGAVTHDLVLSPALDIQEPGFSLNLGKVSEGSIGLSMTGLFAEDGTIPVDLNIAVLDPTCGAGSTLRVVLRRVGEAPHAPPPSILHAPNAGFGPGSLGSGTTVWLVAGLIGAGAAWLCAGVAGACIAALTGARGKTNVPAQRSFTPHMRRVENHDRRPAL